MHIFIRSAHPADNLARKSVDRLGMSPILILSLCVETRIDTRCFVHFSWTRAGKNRKRMGHRCPAPMHGRTIGRNQRTVILHTARCSSTVDRLCSMFAFETCRLQFVRQLVIIGPLFHRPYWIRGRLDSHISLELRQNDKPSQTGKAAQNKDNKRCCLIGTIWGAQCL